MRTQYLRITLMQFLKIEQHFLFDFNVMIGIMVITDNESLSFNHSK